MVWWLVWWIALVWIVFCDCVAVCGWWQYPVWWLTPLLDIGCGWWWRERIFVPLPFSVVRCGVGGGWW